MTGQGSAAGDPDYRAYVGEPENFDRLAALQFGLLTMAGLREHHRLLDVGCGSLRGGRLFIPYLQAGGYHGLEPNPWLVDAAIDREVGQDQIRLKAPVFADNSDFDLSVFGTQFDFILAQSIFSHCGPTQMAACLASASRVLHPTDGLMVATFVERKADRYEDRWVYPGLNHFAWASVQACCRRHGLAARKVDWPHPMQTWFLAAPDSRVLDRVASGGLDLLDDDVLLTPPKFHAKRDGVELNFYRNREQFERYRR